jgi:hypothetical protein
MKKVLFLFTVCFLFFELSIIAQTKDKAPVSPAPSSAPISGAEISFEKETHDYGTIDQGANGVYEFKFKNPGKEPLIITNATGSCGCTVPVWPKEPILPGATSTIKVSYDTKRVGPFSKTVTIVSNAKESPKTITIKGVVNAKPEEETFPAKKVGSGVPLEKN